MVLTDQVKNWYLDRESKSEKDTHQVYSLGAVAHHRVLIGLMAVLQHPRDVSEGGINTSRVFKRDCVTVHLTVSVDGVGWDLDWMYQGHQLLPASDRPSWDSGTLLPAAQLLTVHGKHWLYYMGVNERHDSQFLYGKRGMPPSDEVHLPSWVLVHCNIPLPEHLSSG